MFDFCSKRGQMLKIQRSSNGEVVFTVVFPMKSRAHSRVKTTFEIRNWYSINGSGFERSDPGRSRHGQFSQALRSGQHYAQELPGIYPRLDHERTRRQIALK